MVAWLEAAVKPFLTNHSNDRLLQPHFSGTLVCVGSAMEGTAATEPQAAEALQVARTRCIVVENLHEQKELSDML